MRLKHLVLGLTLWANAAAATPEFWQYQWPNTDFETTSLQSWQEVMSGGVGRDGIRAVDDPSFIPASRETRIGAREPVITLELDGHTPRAYPIRYLTWHEIVNDTLGDLPVAVTFCPLCNSGLVFERRLREGTLTFGVSGMLRNSDMVMFDRETESWWQQALGVGIVGHFTDRQLVQLPAWMESWAEFTARNPEGLVMDQPRRGAPYGQNPYGGYDSSQRPFLYRGENPPHDIPPLVRVVRVGDRAWPLTRLRDQEVIREAGLEISWTAGQASALDSAVIAKGKDVGTVRVRDAEGQDVAHDVMFAFAFHAFWPEGQWMLGR